MPWRYSPLTGQFYDDVINAGAIPGDALYVTPARHAELMEAQAGGASIAPSPETGNPVIVAAPALDLATKQTLAVNAIKAEAERRIVAIMPVYQQLNLIRAEANGTALDQAQIDAFAAIDAIRTASNAIEADAQATDGTTIDQFEVRDNPTWPGVEEN